MLTRFSVLYFLFICSLTSGQAQYQSLLHDDLERTYLVHLPANYTGDDSLALIIAMHGGFGSADNLQSQSQLSVTADEHNFIVAYPEGIQGGILGIRTWNAGWCCGYSSTENIDDVGFISAMLDILLDQYSIDPSRVYATGMSNGGFLSYRLACELSDRIAAIAPVACSMSMNNCEAERPVPIIQFHSYLDENVPYQGGVGTAGPSNHHNSPHDSIMNVWTDNNDCLLTETIVDNDQYTFTKRSDCNCSAEIHHYLTRDGGHSWPGGMTTTIGDPASEFIDANELMWAFFQEHRLDCDVINATHWQNKGSDIIVYPNPSNGIFTVQSPILEGDLHFTVIDHHGKTLLSQTSANINLRTHPNGIYFLKIKNGEQQVIKKIVKF